MEFFKYASQINDIVPKNKNNEKNLSVSFKTLLDNLWSDYLNQTNKKVYELYDFKDKISHMYLLFEGIAANDAKDLVYFIIMTLHLELKKESEKNELTGNQTRQSQLDVD